MSPPSTLVTSRANPRVKQLRAAFAGHARLSDGLIAIEGENLLFEAMRAGLIFRTIFLNSRAAAPEWVPRSVELIQLPDDIFASAVDTQSPQGIAALLVAPASTFQTLFETLTRSLSAAPLLLIASALQDPGNLGTIIRSAEAFAATALLTTPTTVSPWSQKALRASAGSVFRLPIVPISLADLAQLRSSGIHLFAAVPGAAAHNADSRQPKTLPLTSADLTGPCALLIGNEGAGLSEEVLALADSRITIPTPGQVESLNAAIAASVLLYEVSRQRGLTPAKGPLGGVSPETV